MAHDTAHPEPICFKPAEGREVGLVEAGLNQSGIGVAVGAEVAVGLGTGVAARVAAGAVAGAVGSVVAG